jgi:hypothetical protein
MSGDPASDRDAEVRRAYRRGGIGLALAAALWLAAYFVARARGWEEQNLLIPVGAAALSALCFARYLKMKV